MTQSFPDDTKTLRILHPILCIPRALTHFAYHPVLGSGSFSLIRMGLALRPLQHSLTSLLLDFRNVRTDWQSQPPTTIGSLRDWAALRTVACTSDMLISSDSHGLAAVLPPGIRKVDILDNGDIPLGEAVKAVVALLVAADMVPGLESVCVYAGRSSVLHGAGWGGS
ncbi:hypothetical protein Q9L58_010125 [Maublancomyces gigas]|uniref:Uncharacterized protein n=1 Tax=Discina gigas TaxID=1032678 RepID=A0ABR3G565_9PEZI